jgi:hypothetical protein
MKKLLILFFLLLTTSVFAEEVYVTRWATKTPVKVYDTVSSDATFLRLDCSNDPLTNALDLPTIYNSLGNLKIMPDVQGDVGLFGDTDVANGVDGKTFSVNRRAAEGDTYLNFYVNDDQTAYIDSNWDISIRSNLASGVIELGAISTNIVRLIGTVNAIGEPTGIKNLPLRHYGYITNGAAQRYVTWDLQDGDDYYHLTKSGAQILGLKIEMPLDLVANALTTLSTGTFGSTYQAILGDDGNYSFYGIDGTTTTTLNDGTYAINATGPNHFISGTMTVDMFNGLSQNLAWDVPSFWGGYLGGSGGAAYFYDTVVNSVYLADGIYAINATGGISINNAGGGYTIYMANAGPGGAIYTSDSSNTVFLSDGTYAINATGNSLFTGAVTITSTLGAGATTLTGNLTVGNNTTGRNAYIYATLGTEKVPSFDAGNWTCTGGWVANGTTLATTAVSGSITPSAVTNIVAGTTYKITMTISASSTSVYFDIGGAPTIVTTWGGAGSYTWYVTTLTTAKLTISMASSGSGTITALSIKPFTDATGDLLVEGDLYLRSNVQTTNGINFIASDSNAAFRFTSASTSVLMGGAYLRFTGGTSYLDSSLAGNAGFVMRTSKTSALNGISYNFTSGGLGIGIAPTALLHLAAGTATAGTAPLKFTSGTLTSVAVAGQVEYLTDTFYIRGTDKFSYRDAAIYVWSSGDSYLNLVADGAVEVNSPYLNTTVTYAATRIETPLIKTDYTAPADLTITTGAAKTLVLTTSVYDDLQFVVTTGKAPPAGVAATWEAFTTNTAEFAFSVDDMIDLQANEIPHWWKEGTAGNMHLHFTIKTIQNTGANRFAKFTIWVAYADTTEAWVEQAPLSYEYTIPTGSAALTNFYLDMGNITLTNYLIGAQIKCRVKRIAATGGTEYADDVYITQVGCHLEKTRMGSRNEITS